MSLKDLIKGLTKKQTALVPSSFDIIGSRNKAVAIIEIPKELQKKAKVVAKALMAQHKNVLSVLLKASARKGVYRTREMKLIAGGKNTEVIHAESGCRFLLDPKKVYFSPREGTERLRIAEQINENETVMVFFAGIGAFPIILAKKAKPVEVIGIEINPDACGYFWKNIRLNKTENVQVIPGDVKEKAPAFFGGCDRVVMPLPETAADYLEEAVKCLKKRGFIHLYAFAGEKEIDKFSKEAVSKIKRHAKIVSVNKVLPYGPRIWKYRIDINVIP